MPAKRGRLVAVVLVLGVVLPAGTYLVAYLLDRTDSLVSEKKEGPAETPIDPEVLSRPGVAEVRKLGGRVAVDESSPGKPIVGVYLPGAPVTDEGLSAIEGWTSLRELDLSGTRVSDAGLSHLRPLEALEILYLPFTQIKGEGLKSLGALGHLQVLDLSKTGITDAALEHLRGLQRLQVLTLIEAPITDEGLRHLAPLTGLRRLDLTGTQVTDAGLVHLQGLTALESLRLNYAPVTEAGCAALKQKLPNLKISTSE